MTEEKPRYMQQLDEWTENEIIGPLGDAIQRGVDSYGSGPLEDEADRNSAEVIRTIKNKVREKVLESYRNGQKAGPPREWRNKNKQRK